MTRIFILVYLGVLAVLFAAWYIHGAVSRQRAAADKSRVVETAHGGGARTVAMQIDAAAEDQRAEALRRIRDEFDYWVDVSPIDQLPSATQIRLRNGDDVAHFPLDARRDVVACKLANGREVVVLGPFPDYTLRSIEESLGGWMRLAADELNAAQNDNARQKTLAAMRSRFELAMEIVPSEELPEGSRWRIDNGADIVFFKSQSEPEKYLAATPLAEEGAVLRFGPFPSFEKIEQKAAATTLALVLLPAAIAIALLLRPVARQLRHVENAARAIAAGDLSARVDERRVSSATALAEAFNNMASQTESMVRTQRELVQAVSHELRTPLARMRFAIDLIETAADDEERKRRLESLDAATAELDELVGELLTYVKFETMEPQLEREPIAIGDALETMLPKHAAIYPSIEFDVQHAAESDDPTIVADRKGFQRAIGNLLNNAGRHAQGKVRVTAHGGNGAVIVDVDDDGPGIPVEDRQRVFTPFVRLDNDNTGPGTGLGLALVRRIVTRHGGDVEVLSSPLGGCRMRTEWPK